MCKSLSIIRFLHLKSFFSSFSILSFICSHVLLIRFHQGFSHAFLVQSCLFGLLSSFSFFSSSLLLIKINNITSTNLDILFKSNSFNFFISRLKSQVILFVCSNSETKSISMHDIKLIFDDFLLKLFLSIFNLFVLILSFVSSFVDNLFFLSSGFLFLTSNVESFFFKVNLRFLIHVNVTVPEHQFSNGFNRVWHLSQYTFGRLLLGLSLILSKIKFRLLLKHLSGQHLLELDILLHVVELVSIFGHTHQNL